MVLVGPSGLRQVGRSLRMISPGPRRDHRAETISIGGRGRDGRLEAPRTRDIRHGLSELCGCTRNMKRGARTSDSDSAFDTHRRPRSCARVEGRRDTARAPGGFLDRKPGAPLQAVRRQGASRWGRAIIREPKGLPDGPSPLEPRREAPASGMRAIARHSCTHVCP